MLLRVSIWGATIKPRAHPKRLRDYVLRHDAASGSNERVWKLHSAWGGTRGQDACGNITVTLANRDGIYPDKNDGSVRVNVEDGGFTATADVTTDPSLCSVFVTFLLTSTTDGAFALQ